MGVISFSKGSSWPGDRILISHIAGKFFTVWATGEAQVYVYMSIHLMRKANSLEKTLVLGMIEGRRRRGWQSIWWLNGIINSMDVSFKQIPGDSEGQGSLVCCSPWVHKELDTIEWWNNSNSTHTHTHTHALSCMCAKFGFIQFEEVAEVVPPSSLKLVEARVPFGQSWSSHKLRFLSLAYLPEGQEN